MYNVHVNMYIHCPSDLPVTEGKNTCIPVSTRKELVIAASTWFPMADLPGCPSPFFRNRAGVFSANCSKNIQIIMIIIMIIIIIIIILLMRIIIIIIIMMMMMMINITTLLLTNMYSTCTNVPIM